MDAARPLFDVPKRERFALINAREAIANRPARQARVAELQDDLRVLANELYTTSTPYDAWHFILDLVSELGRRFQERR